MRSFVKNGDCVIVILSSGNLSITQSAINLLEQCTHHDELRNLWNAESMFDVAMLLGDCLREVRNRETPFLLESNVPAGANFIIGGQINGGPHAFF
jgi:putative proteasome-type protease